MEHHVVFTVHPAVDAVPDLDGQVCPGGLLRVEDQGDGEHRGHGVAGQHRQGGIAGRVGVGGDALCVE
jgi:hypothetical protein